MASTMKKIATKCELTARQYAAPEQVRTVLFAPEKYLPGGMTVCLAGVMLPSQRLMLTGVHTTYGDASTPCHCMLLICLCLVRNGTKIVGSHSDVWQLTS